MKVKNSNDLCKISLSSMVRENEFTQIPSETSRTVMIGPHLRYDMCASVRMQETRQYRINMIHLIPLIP